MDDERPLAELVGSYLERDGFEVTLAGDGAEAVALARSADPDVVVLDLGLPGLDGVEVCRRIRAHSDAYVVMLTARTDEVDTLIGLSVGADDYVTKPFSPRELAARVEALLRRPRVAASIATERVIGHVTLRTEAREVEIDGSLVELTRIEFDLLDTLSASPKVVFTRAQLLERVWGPDWYADDHVVDVHVANLRKKIDRPGQKSVVRTVRGVGYGING